MLDELAVDGGVLEFVRPRAATDMIIEGMAGNGSFPPYWAQMWASGTELARAVAGHDLTGCSVLELGCGLGLPSIAAARAGARVLATDRSTDALEFTTINARRNAVAVETAECSWDQPGPVVAQGPWDLVLAADVLYEQRNVDWLRDLLPRLVDEAGEVWIADPHRTQAYGFLTGAAAAWRISSSDTRDPSVSIHALRRSATPPGQRHRSEAPPGRAPGRP